MKGLHDRTRGEDIFNGFMEIAEKFNLDFNKLASVTTDGAPAMISSNVGFVAHIREKSSQDLLSFHCIIHQESLCAQMAGNDDLKHVMSTVVKIVNYIKARAMNHRQFVEFLHEVEAEYTDVVYFTEVNKLFIFKFLILFIFKYVQYSL